MLSMIFTLRKACAASSMISQESLDSAMFSLSCLMPFPPVLGVPFLSITLSHSFFASLQLLKQSEHNRELTAEQRVLGGIHFVLVHLEQVKVHTGHSFDKSLERGVDLELLEEAGNDAACGGP